MKENQNLTMKMLHLIQLGLFGFTCLLTSQKSWAGFDESGAPPTNTHFPEWFKNKVRKRKRQPESSAGRIVPTIPTSSGQPTAPQPSRVVRTERAPHFLNPFDSQSTAIERTLESILQSIHHLPFLDQAVSKNDVSQLTLSVQRWYVSLPRQFDLNDLYLRLTEISGLEHASEKKYFLELLISKPTVGFLENQADRLEQIHFVLGPLLFSLNKTFQSHSPEFINQVPHFAAMIQDWASRLTLESNLHFTLSTLNRAWLEQNPNQRWILLESLLPPQDPLPKSFDEVAAYLFTPESLAPPPLSQDPLFDVWKEFTTPDSSTETNLESTVFTSSPVSMDSNSILLIKVRNRTLKKIKTLQPEIDPYKVACVRALFKRFLEFDEDEFSEIRNNLVRLKTFHSDELRFFVHEIKQSLISEKKIKSDSTGKFGNGTVIVRFNNAVKVSRPEKKDSATLINDPRVALSEFQEAKLTQIQDIMKIILEDLSELTYDDLIVSRNALGRLEGLLQSWFKSLSFESDLISPLATLTDALNQSDLIQKWILIESILPPHEPLIQFVSHPSQFQVPLRSSLDFNELETLLLDPLDSTPPPQSHDPHFETWKEFTTFDKLSRTNSKVQKTSESLKDSRISTAKILKKVRKRTLKKLKEADADYRDIVRIRSLFKRLRNLNSENLSEIQTSLLSLKTFNSAELNLFTQEVEQNFPVFQNFDPEDRSELSIPTIIERFKKAVKTSKLENSSSENSVDAPLPGPSNASYFREVQPLASSVTVPHSALIELQQTKLTQIRITLNRVLDHLSTWTLLEPTVQLDTFRQLKRLTLIWYNSLTFKSDLSLPLSTLAEALNQKDPIQKWILVESLLSLSEPLVSFHSPRAEALSLQTQDPNLETSQD